MGLEKRRGQVYYYVKQREGKQVISKYVGKGSFVEAMAALDEARRRRLAAKREAQAEYMRLEAVLDEIQTLTQAITRATLLTQGYHTHQGQWRKRHHGKTNKKKSKQ